jgi:hypothetical protein
MVRESALRAAVAVVPACPLDSFVCDGATVAVVAPARSGVDAGRALPVLRAGAAAVEGAGVGGIVG